MTIDARYLDLLRAAEAILAAKDDAMLTDEEWDALRAAVAAVRADPAE